MRRVCLSILLVVVLIGLNVLQTAGASAATVKSPRLSKTKMSLYVGESKKISLVRGNRKIKSVRFSSSRKKVATVGKKGKYGGLIKARKIGKAVIFCKFLIGKKKYSKKCQVTVRTKTKSEKKTNEPKSTAAQVTPTGTTTPTPKMNITPVPMPSASGEPTAIPTAVPTQGPTPTIEPTPIVDQSEFVMVEDFERYDVGTKWNSYTNGNEVCGTMTVVEDPKNPNNQVLKVAMYTGAQARGYAPVFHINLNNYLGADYINFFKGYSFRIMGNDKIRDYEMSELRTYVDSFNQIGKDCIPGTYDEIAQYEDGMILSGDIRSLEAGLHPERFTFRTTNLAAYEVNASADKLVPNEYHTRELNFRKSSGIYEIQPKNQFDLTFLTGYQGNGTAKDGGVYYIDDVKLLRGEMVTQPIKNLSFTSPAKTIAAGTACAMSAVSSDMKWFFEYEKKDSIEWYSTDTSVAEVFYTRNAEVMENNIAVIHALKEGTCTIVARSCMDSSICASCDITVNAGTDERTVKVTRVPTKEDISDVWLWEGTSVLYDKEGMHYKIPNEFQAMIKTRVNDIRRVSDIKMKFKLSEATDPEKPFCINCSGINENDLGKSVEPRFMYYYKILYQRELQYSPGVAYDKETDCYTLTIPVEGRPLTGMTDLYFQTYPECDSYQFDLQSIEYTMKLSDNPEELYPDYQLDFCADYPFGVDVSVPLYKRSGSHYTVDTSGDSLNVQFLQKYGEIRFPFTTPVCLATASHLSADILSNKPYKIRFFDKYKHIVGELRSDESQDGMWDVSRFSEYREVESIGIMATEEDTSMDIAKILLNTSKCTLDLSKYQKSNTATVTKEESGDMRIHIQKWGEVKYVLPRSIPVIEIDKIELSLSATRECGITFMDEEGERIGECYVCGDITKKIDAKYEGRRLAAIKIDSNSGDADVTLRNIRIHAKDRNSDEDE